MRLSGPGHPEGAAVRGLSAVCSARTAEAGVAGAGGEGESGGYTAHVTDNALITWLSCTDHVDIMH